MPILALFVTLKDRNNFRKHTFVKYTISFGNIISGNIIFLYNPQKKKKKEKLKKMQNEQVMISSAATKTKDLAHWRWKKSIGHFVSWEQNRTRSRAQDVPWKRRPISNLRRAKFVHRATACVCTHESHMRARVWLPRGDRCPVSPARAADHHLETVSTFLLRDRSDPHVRSTILSLAKIVTKIGRIRSDKVSEVSSGSCELEMKLLRQFPIFCKWRLKRKRERERERERGRETLLFQSFQR